MRRLLATAVSPATAALVVLAVAYAVVLRGIGWVPAGRAHAALAFVTHETVWVFLLMPAWLIACCLRIAWGGGEATRIRDGSEELWGLRMLRETLSGAPLVAVPVACGAAIVAITAAPAAEEPTVWAGLVPRAALLALLLAAVAATLVAVFTLARGSWRWMVFAAAGVWLLGAATAGGRPLGAVTDPLSWAVWAQPERAAELTGFSWLGLAVFAGWWFAARVAVSASSGGIGAVAAAVRSPLAGAAVALLIANLIVLASLTGLGEQITWREALLGAYHSAQPELIGLPPVLSFTLSLPVYFAAAFLLLRRMEDEAGAWRELTLLRSGSHRTWVAGSLVFWIRFAVAVLAAAAALTLTAWLLLPDAARNPAPDLAAGAPLVVRFALLGAVQLALYVAVAFAVAWLTRSTVAGLCVLAACAVLSSANGLLGAVLPVYLNSLSRSETGWEGVARDAAVLGVWAALVAATIMLAVRLRDRRSTKGVIHARHRGRPGE